MKKTIISSLLTAICLSSLFIFQYEHIETMLKPEYALTLLSVEVFVLFICEFILMKSIAKEPSVQPPSFNYLFKNGIFFSCITGLLISTISFLYLTFYNPDYITQLIQASMEPGNQLAEASISAQRKVQESLTPLTASVNPFFFTVIWGGLFSLILAAIYKKRSPEDLVKNEN